MFIDTSAFVAIIAGEAEAARLARAIEAAERRVTSPLVRLEAAMVLSTRLGKPPEEAERFFDAVCAEAEIEVVPLTDDIGRAAVAAFARFGKGRGHKAQLNLADCLSYAVARVLALPILFKGRDFAHTDLAIAPY